MPGRRTQTASRNSLLARYSETLGEMTLRKSTERAIRAAKAEARAATSSIANAGPPWSVSDPKSIDPVRVDPGEPQSRSNNNAAFLR